jgi:hypothetical protein
MFYKYILKCKSVTLTEDKEESGRECLAEKVWRWRHIGVV